MQVHKPDYYDTFCCVADACDFTCCQEWTIAVDDATQNRWQQMVPPAAMETDKASLEEYTVSLADSCAIRLNKDRRCPFLNESGLCRLVLEYGEESLSQTCHTFPRERHEFSDRIEYALSPGCRRTLELLWEQESFGVKVQEIADEKTEPDASETPEYQFQIRSWFQEIVSNTELSVPRALRVIFYLALELYQERDTLETDSISRYRASDMAGELCKAIPEQKTIEPDTFLEDNELLLDIADNYRKQGIYTRYLQPIARRAEQYETEKEKEELCQKLQAFETVWKPLESKMRLLLCEEIYSSCVLPYSDLKRMLLKLEWLALEYVVIRQWLFLKWDMTGELSIENLLECVSVVFRMMGYSDDDIEEYLSDSFEMAVWDWGYIDFIL